MKRRILAIVLLVAVLMTAFASVSFAAEKKGTGLYKEGDQWKYYENGKFTKATGMVKKANANTWHYVEKGVYKKVTGLVKCVQPNCSATNKWYYVYKGDKNEKATGLVLCVQPGSSKGKWYYVENGKKKSVTGMVKAIQPGSSAKGKWYYVVKGKQNKGTGLVKCVQPGSDSEGKWYYVKGGKLNKTTGYTKSIQPGKTKGKQYYVKNGKLAVDTKFTKSGNTVKTAYFTLKPESSDCEIKTAKAAPKCNGWYFIEGKKKKVSNSYGAQGGDGFVAVAIKSDPTYYRLGPMGSGEYGTPDYYGFSKVSRSDISYNIVGETSDGMFEVYEIGTAGRGAILNITVK